MADKVVRRVRRVEETGGRDFSFTREMVSAAVDGRAPSFLREYRNMAWEAFERLPMPVTSDEPWRRTDLRGMKAGAFRLPEVEMVRRFPDPPPELLQPLVGGDHGSQMVLLPGDVVEAKMDPEVMAKGVVFTDLITAEREHPEVLAKALGSLVRPDEGKFAALAGAMARTGVLVYVPRGVELEQPLHSVIWGPGSGLAYFSHVLVSLEEGSSLTYIHEAASPTEAQGQTLHCGIVEIHVGPAANFRFVALQSWGASVWHFNH